jgi:hypothetical protein
MGKREAGRELDAEIAEKVMGWIGVVPEFVGADGGRWFVWSGKPSLPARRYAVPEYSTNFAAAWEVVEKMRADGWFVELTIRPHARDEVVVCKGFNERRLPVQEVAYADDDSVALAICVAALKTYSGSSLLVEETPNA